MGIWDLIGKGKELADAVRQQQWGKAIRLCGVILTILGTMAEGGVMAAADEGRRQELAAAVADVERAKIESVGAAGADAFGVSPGLVFTLVELVLTLLKSRWGL